MQKRIEAIYPPITTYQQYAGPLSFILPQESAKVWFCCSHVQLYVDFGFSTIGEIKFMQELVPSYPFLRCSGIDDYRLLFSKSDLIDKIKNLINNNIAVAINIDRYYIPIYTKKGHLVHAIYILGYDDENEMLDIADFVQEGKYVFTSISYKCFVESINEMDNQKYHSPDSKYFLSMFAIKEREYTFNKVKLRQELLDYYNCQNTLVDYDSFAFFNKSGETFRWGLDVYNWLLDLLAAYLEASTEKSQLDHRQMYILKDHKNAMLWRLDYLIGKKILKISQSLYNGYTELFIKSGTLLNLCLKYNITYDRKIIDKMIKLTQEIAELDSIYTKKFLDELETKQH